MILKNCSFLEFAASVRADNKGIILWGAGTMLMTWIPYLCREYGLTESVLCCIDNDENKWNGTIKIGDKIIPVKPKEALFHYDADKTVILITNSYFADIIEQLDRMPLMSEITCYIAPVMHITHCEDSDSLLTVSPTEYRIPKVIHYCWFGGGKMPELNRRCVESWKLRCPGYEIVRWDENNYDVNKNLYMRQAYERRRFGFVPDYARIDILYQHGGLYFDTDVELLREPTELMALDGFCSFEEWPNLNFGSGSGAVKGSPVLKSILDFREDARFVKSDGSLDLLCCGYFESLPLADMGLRMDGMMQKIQNFAVLPSDYFNPLSSVTGLDSRKSHTVGIHYMNLSWADPERRNGRQRTKQMFDKIMQRIETGGYKDE